MYWQFLQAGMAYWTFTNVLIYFSIFHASENLRAGKKCFTTTILQKPSVHLIYQRKEIKYGKMEQVETVGTTVVTLKNMSVSCNLSNKRNEIL